MQVWPGVDDVVCLDVGSTFTKGIVVGPDGSLRARAAHPTTVSTDVMEGVTAVRDALGLPEAGTIACSSAGGGLRLAVVGYEAEVTAEAGRRVGLSAGAKVVHVSSRELLAQGIRDLRAAQPDIVLLTGGTDGGNARVLTHNAAALARARFRAPVVVAGNADAADEVSALLTSTRREHTVVANVLPRIGVIAPEAARAAIRQTFLTHVIGGKGLSRGRAFADLVAAATPDAMLSGVEVLAEVAGGDVLVVDIGGATTDVYSVIEPAGEDATIHRDVVATLWHARTVEADLGMRWNAATIVDAAAREGLPLPDATVRYAARVAGDPAYLPASEADWSAERDLARAAALIAVRRHARPMSPSERPRPLTEVALVVGSGGVLRHAPDDLAQEVLRAVLDDHAGGWRVPQDACAIVDRDYLLFAVGLLSRDDPQRARALAHTLIPA
jgi:uncharacterized protein (TIGR01319 family)